MSVANSLWGAPRIHGELLKLGMDVGQTTVAKYMAKRRRPPSQGWRTSAMLKAIDILKETGFDYIVEHEQHLMRRTIAGLQEIGRVTLYGDTENIADKVGTVVFNIAGRPHGEVAQVAKRRAIAVRQGALCSHPYVWRLLRIPNDEIVQVIRTPSPALPGMVRASFGIYNNDEEVDALIETVRRSSASQFHSSKSQSFPSRLFIPLCKQLRMALSTTRRLGRTRGFS
jgi:cysteine sulfinate desulfinase/cysteine desulfurase-like protein